MIASASSVLLASFPPVEVKYCLKAVDITCGFDLLTLSNCREELLSYPFRQHLKKN